MTPWPYLLPPLVILWWFFLSMAMVLDTARPWRVMYDDGNNGDTDKG